MIKHLWKHLQKTDGWENAVTMLGTAYAALSHHKMVGSAWLTYQELDDLYTDDSVARRIILEPIKAAFKKGFILTPPAELDTELAQDLEKEIRDLYKDLKAQDSLLKALAWGRLYGRGGLLLGVEDGAQDPTDPLVLDRVRTVDWFRDVKAESFSSECLDEDIHSTRYGYPLEWRVMSEIGGINTVVHRSRLILTGSVPTNREMMEENEWREIPILQSIEGDLRNYDSAKTGISQMLVDASQAVLKILNLPGVLADDDTILKARLRVLEFARALHIMPINAGDMNGNGAESFEFVERTFSGVADAFDSILGALSTSVGWPQTYLYGRSPAGENATGESDRDMWDDFVLLVQEGECLPPLQQIVDLIAATIGSSGWTVSFPPLKQMSETEKLQNQKTVAETDAINIGNGLLDEVTVGQWRFGGDEPNFEPVRIPQEDVDAMQTLKSMDLERAQVGVPEAPKAPTVEGPEQDLQEEIAGYLKVLEQLVKAGAPQKLNRSVAKKVANMLGITDPAVIQSISEANFKWYTQVQTELSTGETRENLEEGVE